MRGHDIIVIGASAGGVEALVNVVRTLPPDLSAAVFITLHIPADSPSMLPAILSRSGPLPAIHPEDGANIEPGMIYVAPADNHLQLESGIIRVVHGPKENRHRPAIDPMFRSAALAYGPRVLGVILTGAMDDGTAGLLAIKRSGGIAIVQDPNEALYSSMPLSALAHVQVDYVLPVAAIGTQLTQLVQTPVSQRGAASMHDEEEMAKEVSVVENESSPAIVASSERAGTPSPFSCPECGGVLWEIQDGDLLRFRCRVGHAYSRDSVLAAQTEEVERALWIAFKILAEQASLSQRLATHAHKRGQDALAQRFEEKLHNAQEQAAIIQRVLRNHTQSERN